MRGQLVGPVGVIQRKCAGCGAPTSGSGECASCAGEDHRGVLDLRRQSGQAPASAVPASVTGVLRSSGEALSESTRSRFEAIIGHDFRRVRVHSDGAAAVSARQIGAMAYTHGDHIVFGRGQYAPETASGKELLAHELTHVVQQSGGRGGAGALSIGSPDSAAEREADAMARQVTSSPGASVAVTASGGGIQRACLSAAECAGPIAGSSTEFGTQEEDREAAARARRARMSPARQRSTGHTGHARQLERFLDAEAPGLRANIHGIFVDQDLSPGTGALTMDCAAMVPPITGATKPCVFIHGRLNQEALAFNTSAAAVIGGQSREDWRVGTVQTLTHEIQHVVFDNAGRPDPAGAAGCTRASVEHELSELNAIMSEFPVAFRAIPAGAPAADPARTRLANWFNSVITNPSESIRGILKKMRCACDCAQVDAWVIDTFDFVAASWTAAERTAFNTELRSPVWALSWPL